MTDLVLIIGDTYWNDVVQQWQDRGDLTMADLDAFVAAWREGEFETEYARRLVSSQRMLMINSSSPGPDPRPQTPHLYTEGTRP